jgi:signal transduction histidine kinase
MKNLSLRARLTLWYTIALVAVLLLFGIDVLVVQARLGIRRADRELESVHATLANVLREELKELDSPELAATEARNAIGSLGDAIAILDRNGTPLATQLNHVTLADLTPAAGVPATARTIETPSGSWRVHIEPETFGTVTLTLVIARPLDDVAREQHEVREAMLVVVPLALLLAGAGGLWLASIGLRPITLMARRATSIPLTGLEDLGPAPRDDELGQLARAFNGLVSRLRTALATQRQFMADASHELRTPVSIIRTAADVTLNRDHREEAEYREALEMARGQAQRLGRLVEDMLALARADAGAYPLHPVDLYLDDVVEDCRRAVDVLAAARGITVTSTGATDVPVRGDEELLRRLLVNLLQNAVQHSTRGGLVSVDVSPSGSRVFVRVADCGPGIPEADRARIFDRFVQLDPSRHHEGTGLGLTIAKWIAEAHHGTLTLETSGPAGSTFCVDLPCAVESPAARPTARPFVPASLPILVLLAALWAVQASAQTGDDAPPAVRATSGTAAIRLDGLFDEAAWSAAEAIPTLTMIEPSEGSPASFTTTVRLLLRPTALYLAITCDDPEPDRIVSFTKQRDGSLRNEDHIKIVLDTFLDGRSGYVFQVNPSGARYDALINPGGDSENSNWDGIWMAATRRNEKGWSLEIWIPTQTLAFKKDLRSWHFNVERRIQRLQETDRWASPRRDWKLTQTSRAGLITEVPRLSQGRGLSVRPAVTAGGGINGPGQPVNHTGDASLDVTQRVGPNLVSSLSINTDFAESEVDTRRTNLTRFPLFFPETRTFFLEGSDIFSFGLGLGNDVIPFFSRRIGLVAGREQPILFGTKINGRIGNTNVGGLVTRTRDATGLAPAESMASVRIKKNVLGESSVGLIATAGDPLGRGGSWLAGPDVTFQTSHFRRDKNLRAGAWALLMDRAGATGDRSAMGARIDYPNDLWELIASTMRIGDGFDPSLGFVPRRAMFYHRLQATNTPKFDGWLRQMEHEVQLHLYTNLSGDWESYRNQIVPFNWRFASGERVEINVVPTGERLVTSFDVADNVRIPPGAYHWTRYRLEEQFAAKRKFSGQLTWWFGGFYTGTLDQIIWTAAWHPSALITVELTGERDVGDLREGRFVEAVTGTRLRFNVSPDMQISSYWQYDTQTRSIGTNSKLRWTFRAVGDLFVIYNHNVREVIDRWQLDSNQLLVKLQYALRY